MKLVIFDFDGVFVDTLIMHYKISQEVNPGLSLDAFRSRFDGNVLDSEKRNPNIKMYPGFSARYEAQSRELDVPEALKQVVRALHRKYILSIISSTPSGLVLKILGQAGTAEYFSDILGADVHKSKVEKNNILLRKYNLSPEDALYITDTTGDIGEANECGIRSIAVTWGFHLKEKLEKAKPFRLIDTPEELQKAIEESL